MPYNPAISSIAGSCAATHTQNTFAPRPGAGSYRSTIIAPGSNAAHRNATIGYDRNVSGINTTVSR